MSVKSLEFTDHPRFRKGWSGFNEITSINVIIGKNNVGKSRLLDLIDAIVDPRQAGANWRFRHSGILEERKLRLVFHEGTSGGALGNNHWRDHGALYVGKQVVWEKSSQGETLSFTVEKAPPSIAQAGQLDRDGMIKTCLSRDNHFLQGKSIRRLLSDRDISRETATPSMLLTSAGQGATNIIRRYITSANLPREVIQSDLLSALNTIFGSDGSFSEIQVRQHDEVQNGEFGDLPWEVFLGETSKGLIALSKSGSGLKTVILVLLNLLVIPKMEKSTPSNYVFELEELENNLHPSLLRRLLIYIEKYAVDNSSTIFLTTHSSTALDLFSTSPNAKITHVGLTENTAFTRPVNAHFERVGVINEIGAKPSDLLQANGIVWVEGPSDRIYFNRWVEIVSDGKLKEGRHYQCAFYGGALLARLQAVSPETIAKELVNLVAINNNIIFICDSDRRGADADLKARVLRIEKEVASLPEAYIWITQAKEIENYLPGTVLSAAFKSKELLPDPKPFESFFPSDGKSQSYLQAKLKRRTFDKVDIALATSDFMTTENMAGRFDWAEHMKKIAARIFSWNQ